MISASDMGRIGGKAGTGSAKRRTPEQCRAAARKRWDKVRKKNLKPKRSNNKTK